MNLHRATSSQIKLKKSNAFNKNLTHSIIKVTLIKLDEMKRRMRKMITIIIKMVISEMTLVKNERTHYLKYRRLFCNFRLSLKYGMTL